MNSYLDLIAKDEKAHPRKNRITILTIAIAVCLVSAIFGMADMEMRSQTLSAIKTYGNYHAAFKGINSDTADLIRMRPDVAVSGWISQIGSRDGYTLHGKELAISGADEPMAAEMGIEIMAGRFPQTAEEALLGRQALEQFSLSIGDVAPVTYPDGSERSYKIVGTFRDFSSLKKEDVHGLIVDVSGMKSILGQAADDWQDWRFYVQFAKGARMRQAMDEIQANFSLSDDQIAKNTLLLGLAGQSDESYAYMLYRVAGVLFVLVLTAGVLMIASSFNMRVLERVQFFGLLRCLGASKRQIRRFVLSEGLRFSLKGIPLGLLAGTAIVWIASAFLKFFNPVYFQEIPLFGLSWLSLISGALVGFLSVLLASHAPGRMAASVSPLNAVSGNLSRNAAGQAKKAPRFRLFSIEVRMGLQHAFSDTKNILLITGSFAITIVLFLAFSVSIDFMHQRPYTPDLSILGNADGTLLDSEVSVRLAEIPGIERIYGRMMVEVPFMMGNEAGSAVLLSYEENQFNWAKNELTEGSLSAVIEGSDTVLSVFQEEIGIHVGDTIRLDFLSGEREVKLAGVLATSPFDRTAGSIILICSEETFRQLSGSGAYTIIDMQLAGNAGEETVRQVRALVTEGLKLSDRRQSNVEGKAAFYTYAIFIYGFLVIIAAITVLSIVNSMNNSVFTRINTYGRMRAVGMSGVQLSRMIMAEAGVYAACGALAGCVFGLPVHYGIFGMMITAHWHISWDLPLAALLVIVGLVVLSALLSVLGPVKRIGRMDVVSVVNAQ